MATSKANGADQHQKKKKMPKDDLFNSLNPNEMLSSAQRVLSSAVNVLEEEIAAGILAAKKIEKKIIDVEDIRSDPDDLMNRIRRDTHEALDIFLDALTAITRQVSVLSDSITKESKTKVREEPVKTTTSISVIQTEKPLKPSQTGILYMSVEGDLTIGPVTINLQKTDLTGPGGQKIPAKNILCRPASFSLNPGEVKEVAIHVKVPATCLPGRYKALLCDDQNSDIQTVIDIEVI